MKSSKRLAASVRVWRRPAGAFKRWAAASRIYNCDQLRYEPRACTCSTRERSPLSGSSVTPTRSLTTELEE
eukprot:scaffold104276_cov75-Phaeocystis_antarctica.AAC.2